MYGKTFVIPCTIVLIISIFLTESDTAFWCGVGATIIMLLAIYKDWLDDKRQENDRRLSWRD